MAELDYSNKDYWNHRYSRDTMPFFDWYVDPCQLEPVLSKYFPENPSRSLIVGCGNSRMGEYLLDMGWDDIMNIDISDVVIEKMSRYYSKEKNLKFMVMDVKQMIFSKDSFNCIIDKGLIDVVLCENDGENTTYQQILSEIYRVLKSKGYFFMLSYSDSNTMFPILASQPWNINRLSIAYPPSSLLIRQIRTHLGNKSIYDITQEIWDKSIAEVKELQKEYLEKSSDEIEKDTQLSMVCNCYICHKL